MPTDTRTGDTRTDAAPDSFTSARPRTGNELAIVGLALALAAALFGIVAVALSVRAVDESKANRAEAVAGGSVAAAEPATVIDVSLSDFKFTPSVLTAPAGTLRLRVTNKGPSAHDLAILGVGRIADLKQGESAVLDLPALEPGGYEIVCDISGHKEAGMVGKLTITGEVGAGTATSAANTPGAAHAADWQAVDAAHKKVVDDFLSGPPAKTEGLGNQPLQPKLENGTKVFELTAAVVQWEVSPGRKYEAWTYNGTVPGPEIRVKQGETVKVRLKNSLPMSTSIHFHGLEVADNKQDGVTFVTQDPIKPGESYEYTLTPINSGSHMYHSHHAADAQVPLGLIGAFIVEPTSTPVPAFAAHDSEYTQILNDGPLGFGINGKGFPATAPIVAKQGERTLVRFMNEGLIIHPMHLHGHRMTVVAKDGYFLPQPYDADTLNIAPGERYDVIITSLYPGVWAFHCHILTHAESAEGLHGMTTVWVVQAADPAPATTSAATTETTPALAPTSTVTG